jgi:hypothetical protein
VDTSVPRPAVPSDIEGTHSGYSEGQGTSEPKGPRLSRLASRSWRLVEQPATSVEQFKDPALLEVRRLRALLGGG